MKKTSKRRLALAQNTVKILAELPGIELRHVVGGNKTSPDTGCSGEIKTIDTTAGLDCLPP